MSGRGGECPAVEGEQPLEKGSCSVALGVLTVSCVFLGLLLEGLEYGSGLLKMARKEHFFVLA